VAVHDGNHPERLFIRRVGNQVVPHADEAKRAVGKVRAPVATVGKRDQAANGVKDFCNDPVGCIGIVRRDIGAYVVEVSVGFRVKRLSRHAGRLRSDSVLAIRRAKASSPSMSFTRPLLMSS
jgi:hypothetical protein